MLLMPARNAWFDVYQRLMPRVAKSQEVTIIAIDEATLAAIGQWPWPRHLMAALIERIASYQPKVIGLDIIFAEPDHASPEAVAETRQDLPEPIRAALNSATSNDAILAEAIHQAPIVLGVAGFSYKTAHTLQGLRINAVDLEPNASLALPQYPYVLASLPSFQSVARSQALLLTEIEDGLIRRSPLLASINGSVVPSLSLEMLRIAHGQSAIKPITKSAQLQALQVGSLNIPVANNAEAWIHYDAHSGNEIVSALNVLQGQVPAEKLHGKLVLVGLTGLGLTDWITTARGERRPGVEVHAQLMQSFIDGRFVTRPSNMAWLEAVALLLAGSMVIVFVPMMRPRRAVLLWVSIVALIFAMSLLLFWQQGLLFDAVNLNIGLTVVFVWLLVDVLTESQRQRKLIAQTLQTERLASAKVAGELESARRIQLNSLPDADVVFANEQRFSIATYLEPAREIGGDLYDCFMLDSKQLFIAVGDVSGKGVPASLFMAVTRALAKSLALRGKHDLASVMTSTNAELSRDNPEMLFVTMVAAVLNVETGVLTLCNAGHEAPWRWSVDGSLNRLKGDNGPPFCMLDDYVFTTQSYQLTAGDKLLLLSDGVTEAMDEDEDLYGTERVDQLLTRLPTNTTAEGLKQALCEDVAEFVGEAEPSDDITLLTLQWFGK